MSYPAADIQAAIIDAAQPDSLTSWHLLTGPKRLDWEQQRRILGFD